MEFQNGEVVVSKKTWTGNWCECCIGYSGRYELDANSFLGEIDTSGHNDVVTIHNVTIRLSLDKKGDHDYVRAGIRDVINANREAL